MKEAVAIHVFDILSFHDIRVLTISGNDFNTAIWASLVGSMPKVERLFIECRSNPDLLAPMHLGSISKATGNSAGDITAFSKLKTLQIHFSSYVDEGEFHPVILERLVRDLESRKAGGLELGSLCVQNWKGANEETVERLRGVIHHLAWDAD